MATFTRYTLREVLRNALPSFVGLSLLVMVGFAVQLLRQGIDVVRLRALVPHLFFYAASAVISAAFLTSIIMTFGRMTEDNELLAIRCAGIHVRRVIVPVILASFLVAMVAATLETCLVPWSRRQITRLRFAALKEVLANKLAVSADRQLKVPGYVVTYGRFQDGLIQDVQVLELKKGLVQTIISARQGALDVGEDGAELPTLWLSGCTITSYGQHGGQGRSEELTCKDLVLQLPLSGVGQGDLQKLSFLSLDALLAERAELVAHRPADAPRHRDPRAVGRRLRKERRDIAAQIDEVRRQIEPIVERQHAKLLDTDGIMRKLDAVQIRVENEREAQDVLVKELRQRTTQVRQIRENKTGEIDYEQLGTLEKRIEQIPDLLARRKDELGKLYKEQEQFQSDLAQNREQLDAIASQLQTLRKRQGELKTRYDATLGDYEEAKRQEDLLRIDILLHKRLSLAFSCVSFALIGIPFGIIAHRGNIVVALGLSFGIVLLVFYPVLIAAEFLAQGGQSPLLLWASNVGVCAMGLYALERVVKH